MTARYFIDYSGGSVQVYPSTGFKIKGYRDGYRYREKLDGAITLSVRNGYDELLAIQGSNDYCTLRLEVKRSGVYTERVRGYFYPKECRWNESECKVEVRCAELDTYNSILLNQDKKVNIRGVGLIDDTVRAYITSNAFENIEYDIAHTYPVNTFERTLSGGCWRWVFPPIDNTTQGYLSAQPNNPTYQGYQCNGVEITVAGYGAITWDAITGYNDVPVPAQVKVKFIRQVQYTFDNAAPSGQDWTNVSSQQLNGATVYKWCRQPRYIGVPFTQYNYYGQQTCFPIPLKYGNDSTGTTTVDYGHYWYDLKGGLQRIIDELAGSNTYTIVSDLLFSDTDPITGGPNDYYRNFAGQPQGRRAIYITSKSNVILVTPTEVASRVELSWKEVTDMIRETFNADWYIDGNTIRIEHISYFEGGFAYPSQGGYTGAVVDLRGNVGARNRNQYEFDNQKYCHREEWNVADASGLDFQSADILYTAKFNSDKEVSISHDLTQFATDLANIANDPTSIDNAGFCLAVIEDRRGLPSSGYYEVLNYPGGFTGTEQTNGLLAMSTLHNKFWRHGRPFPQGQMNYQTINLTSVSPNRKGVPVQIDNCTLFNPYLRYLTEIGIGEVYEYTEDFITNIVEVTLHYPN